MDLEEGQSNHELKIAENIDWNSQVLTDFNDNTQIVIEPPKSPNKKHSYCSRRLKWSQQMKVTTKVTVHPNECCLSEDGVMLHSSV